MMGRIKAPISEKSLASLSKRPGMHAVGDPAGLYLNSFKGSRAWILRFMLEGRRRDMGLGSYLDLTLAEAREKAREKRKLILDGIDPIEAKREQRDISRAGTVKRVTFQKCVDGYLDAHGDSWRNPKHRAQWRSTLERYACSIIGSMNVATVDTPLVMAILEPIWKEKTETASRLRGRIENVLAWATVRKYRHGENPARWKGHLDQLLAKPSKISKVKHHAALPYQQVGSFMQDLRKQKGIGASALEFAILTAARSGEVRGATWAEIDLPGKTWTIAGSRMKVGKKHRIPLSTAALAVLTRMGECQLSIFIFPSTKENKPLSDMSLTAVLKRMKRNDLTAHGFRSTFRDWAAESTAYPAELAEMALAHTIDNKTEAAYRRGDLLEKRVQMMATWASYCAKPLKASAVVQIRKATK
jgi:integrase